MRNSLTIIFLFVWPCITEAQAIIGFEQYFYVDKTGLPLVIPRAYAQNEHNWYVESDINYEQLNTFSLYIGKTFSENEEFSYSVTPIIGGVLGSLKGGVLGLNTEMTYKNILFISQSHYVFSFKNNSADLLYNWMDLGYQVIGRTLIGLSMQTSVFNAVNMKLETGVFIRFSIKKWNFPVYCFNTYNESRYLIIGVTREFNLPVKRTIVMQSANRQK
jgi:hypothetical protein